MSYRFVILLFAWLIAGCAPQLVKHPLQEIQADVSEEALAALYAERHEPILYVSGVAYRLNDACFGKRIFDFGLEQRQFQMFNEERAYLNVQEQRKFSETLQARQYIGVEEERLYQLEKQEREYLQVQEERLYANYQEERAYLNELQQRQYLMSGDGLYCTIDRKTQSVVVMRKNETPVPLSYYYLGELITTKSGKLALN